jgi:hypothetical protein
MVGTTRNDSSFFVLGETDFDAVVEATFPGNRSAQQAAEAVFGVGGTLGLDSVFDAVSVFSSTQGLCVSLSYSLTVLLCLKFWEVIYLYG